MRAQGDGGADGDALLQDRAGRLQSQLRVQRHQSRRVAPDARLGPGAWPDGIRVNAVAPGNVFEGSKIWNPEYIKTAARKKGIQPEEVIPYYTSLTALKREIKRSDIAAAIVFLCSDAARCITGPDAGGGWRTGDGAMSEIRQDDIPELETALYGGSLESRLDALRQLCARLGEEAAPGHQLPHPHQRILQRVPLALPKPSGRPRAKVSPCSASTIITPWPGHESFAPHARSPALPPRFSMEAVAMDRAAEAGRLLLNDPDNPGRVYLCGKGVTRIPSGSRRRHRTLARMRAALDRRNREMTAKVGRTLPRSAECRWPRVGRRARPHAARQYHRAARSPGRAVRLREHRRRSGSVPGGNDRALLRRCSPGGMPTMPRCRSFSAPKLLKAGAPCFVRETEDAFVSTEELRSMFPGVWRHSHLPGSG